MILKAILCVHHFCSFGAMLFFANLLNPILPAGGGGGLFGTTLAGFAHNSGKEKITQTKFGDAS